VIPTRPNDPDDPLSDPIADLPLFTEEEIQAASGSGAESESEEEGDRKPEKAATDAGSEQSRSGDSRRVEPVSEGSAARVPKEYPAAEMPSVKTRAKGSVKAAAKASPVEAPPIETTQAKIPGVQETLPTLDERPTSGSHLDELDFGDAYADQDAVADPGPTADPPERDSTGPIHNEPDQTGPIESVDSERSATPGSPDRAPLVRRFHAAALDAAAMIAVLITLVGGATLLGAPSGLAALPYYLPTWLLFSLIYHVVPLLFWGSTPGMAYVGVVTRAITGGPLTVDQALRRWLAGAVTTLLLGLPGLMALSGASFADRVSHTTTRYLA
jgi:uncharacterized RDD family membrane protein YckC